MSNGGDEMRIITFLIAVLLSNTIFAFSIDAQATTAKSTKREWNYSANIYNVLVNTCNGTELVMTFSQPITDRLRLMSVKEDSNDLMKKLEQAKFSKIYGINTKTLVTVALEKGAGVAIAIDEIVDILAKSSAKETKFAPAGKLEKLRVQCQTPERYFGYYSNWVN